MQNFTTWDLMQNRLANAIKSGNGPVHEVQGGLCISKRVVFPNGFLAQNMMVKI
jgi:hypothetical protein